MKNILVMLVMMFMSLTASAADKLKPFVYAYTANGDIESVSSQIEKQLTAGGFAVIGQYTPFDGTKILAITNDALKKNASESEFGGYGAAQRVSMVKSDDGIQVSYTNPVYMAHAYQMEGDLSNVSMQLEKIVGRDHEFGPEKAMTPKQLRKYHYMFGMEYFDDHDDHELIEGESYQQLVNTVAANLKRSLGGVSQVYRIDIPGKDETVFGVALKAPNDEARHMDDAFIMNEIDFKKERSAAHLPYEILVSGNKAYSLYARFRIAINFPDLSMMGSNSFMNIMSSPDAIKDALTLVAGGKAEAQAAPAVTLIGGGD